MLSESLIHSLSRAAIRCLCVLFLSFVSIITAKADTRSQLGLPPVPIPDANPQTSEKVALGKRLFFDSALSADGRVSCASCHQPEHAFSDGRKVARGAHGKQGTRNAPSLLNVAYNTSQFWDGRRQSLERQALDPLMNPLEHGLRAEEDLLGLIRKDELYPSQFAAAFPKDSIALTPEHVAQAIASYERTLIAGDSAFDEFLYGDNPAALSSAAQRGYQLFRGAGRCADCHSIGPREALFTDNSYHSSNVALARISRNLASLTQLVVERRKQTDVTVDETVLTNLDIAELGRFVLTLDPADIAKFKTPSLRNVAVTAPYMHDGSVPTLRGAVERELYDRSAPGRPLILTPQEKDDLVAFLKALTSPMALQLAGAH